MAHEDRTGRRGGLIGGVFKLLLLLVLVVIAWWYFIANRAPSADSRLAPATTWHDAAPAAAWPARALA